MNDYWNDPPDTPEPPECCDDYMDVESDGACKCLTCGKRIEPQPDPDPSVFADMELPDDYPNRQSSPAVRAKRTNIMGNTTHRPNYRGQRPCSAFPSFDEALALFDRAKAEARNDTSDLQADRIALLAVYERLKPNSELSR